MREEIYQKVFEKLLNEFSSMGGGAVGGVSTPLGTGPKAGAKGENIYKKSTATDKKHRSKGKKKKTYTRSVQWYLKNGGEKGRKRTFKEVFNYYLKSSLQEARTSRIKDFKKSEIISFLRYLKGEVQDNISFDTTEKIAGQSMTVGIKGTSKGNIIYCATKDTLLSYDNDIFNPRFKKAKGTSGLVKKAFIRNFRKLQKGEEIVLGMEIVINDYRKPDYIAYHVPRGKEYAAIFSIKPEGSFSRQDANKLSGKYWSRRHRAESELEVLLPQDIPLTPSVDIDDSIIQEIDDIIKIVEESPIGRGGDADTPVKTYIDREVSPRIRNLVKTIFPSSNINVDSPIEGIAVNMTSGDNTSFFKVPNEDFNRLQSIQAAIYAEFRVNKYSNNYDRAESFLVYANLPTTGQSFPRNTLKLIKHLHEAQVLPKNFRTFFSPAKFKHMCSQILEGLKTSDVNTITDGLNSYSKRLYTSKGIENFNCVESQQLLDYVKQNNLL